MYEEFYNLREKPFNLTPSPRFLYLGETHKEALALLTYGVMERKGFVLLTGEVGTGKTTMVHALLANLDQNIQSVYLTNPVLSPREFLDYLACSAFKQKIRFDSKTNFLFEFQDLLKEYLRNQRHFILILDEAQKLSLEVLEEIRLLSNLETSEDKLLTVLLVGQPELNEKLNHPECRALLQRIAIRYHIPPLGLDDTQEYIKSRLKMAGAENGQKIFAKHAITLIHQYSRGYPRSINILADNALLLGFATGKKHITPEMIEECQRETIVQPTPKLKYELIPEPHSKTTNEETRKPFIPRALKWGLAVLLALLLLLAINGRAQFFLSNIKDSIFRLHQTRPVETLENKTSRLQPPPDSETRTVRPPSLNTPPYSVTNAHSLGIDPQAVPPHAQPTSKTSVSHEIVLLEEHRQDWQTTIVTEGDTLTKLAKRIYGKAEDNILDSIKLANPDLKDINHLTVGQELVFPPLAEPAVNSIYARSPQ